MEPPDRDAEAPLLDFRYKDDVGLDELPTGSEMVQEAKHQLQIGVPIVLMGWLDFTVNIIGVAFVGHLGSLHLAGAAMAASFANVFGFAILEGLAQGLETTGGQALGSGQPRLLGMLLQRGQVVLVMFCLPIGLLWLHATWVLNLWGQDPEIADLAGQYVIYLLPGLFATACFLPVAKFLQVQGVTRPLAWVSCLVLLLHGPVCYLYVYVLNMGYVGAALATSTSNTTTLIILVLFLNFERSGILSRTWPGFSLAAFRNLVPFLALALPACAMTSFEWWVWEIIQLMAGWLPHPEVSVSSMTISFQTIGICFMVPFGLAAATSVRVANELGAQRPGRTRWVVIVALTMTSIAGGVLALFLLIVRKYWALLFVSPSEAEVLKTVIDTTPVVVVASVGIAWNACFSGVLRGSGQQLAGSLINVVSLYGVSLPVAYLIGVKWNGGVPGLLWGMMVGFLLQLIGQCILTCGTNWEYQARRALNTVRSNDDQTQTKSIIY
ncbi:hypothetical protein Mapa_011928 [Marchantia paleacea]|nr:hypothetical protein Mapa_011928 [Marchantia paleacea]